MIPEKNNAENKVKATINENIIEHPKIEEKKDIEKNDIEIKGSSEPNKY